MNATHSLLRNRLVAHVERDEEEQPTAVVIPLHSGDRVRIEQPADVARLIRTLRACHDTLKQGA